MAASKNASTPKPNDHVRQYLRYYLSFKHPPYYSVMLNGAWGVGKSFLIDAVLSENFPNQDKGEQKYVYISLFGLSTIDEIDEALFEAIHPLMASRGAQITGRIAKAIAKKFAVDPELKIKDLLPKAKIDVYVFDDLERCNIKSNAVLGYINELVEHDGRKVVIIANEKEIENTADYARRREKVIGVTLQVEPMLEAALPTFIAKSDSSKFREFLTNKSDEIKSLFQQSGNPNLRILQQTIWDFERLFSVLTDTHRANDEAMTTLLRLLFALSFESKAGNIAPEMLNGRESAMVRAVSAHLNKESEPAAIDRVNKRYPEVDLGDAILADDVLVDILERGVYNIARIHASLDNSRYFVTPDQEPSWRTVWFAIERAESDFEKALSDVTQKVEARAYTDPGEILQLTGIYLWLADLKVIPGSRSQIVSEWKSYIDDLEKAKKLPPIPIDDWLHAYDGGAGGLMFYEKESPEFQEVSEYMRRRREQVRDDQYPELAKKLLDEMVKAPELFFRRLCYTNSEDNIYAGVPILSAIDPKEFVSELLKQSPNNQRKIMRTFRERYDIGPSGKKLLAEKKWLEHVNDELSRVAANSSKIGEFRIRKLLEWNINPALSRLGAA